jgi:hypothetical protein
LMLRIGIHISEFSEKLYSHDSVCRGSLKRFNPKTQSGISTYFIDTD